MILWRFLVELGTRSAPPGAGKTYLVTLQELDEEPVVFDEVFPLRPVAPAAFQKSHHHYRVSLLWPTKGFRAKALSAKKGRSGKRG